MLLDLLTAGLDAPVNERIRALCEPEDDFWGDYRLEVAHAVRPQRDLFDT
jgi:hypothetical protein